jgi:hypothetical protein
MDFLERCCAWTSRYGVCEGQFVPCLTLNPLNYSISVDVQHNRVAHSTVRDDAGVRIRIFPPDKPVQIFRRFVSKAVPARRASLVTSLITLF